MTYITNVILAAGFICFAIASSQSTALAGASGGRIVAANDDWTFSEQGFNRCDPTRFAQNLCAWFSGGKPGRFLVYSTHFGLTGQSLAKAVTSAGHTWVVDANASFTLANLSTYDGIFLGWGSENPGVPAVDFDILRAYVRSGGNVYVFSGCGCMAGAWNPFLSRFGLAFETFHTDDEGCDPIHDPHPIFEGVASLYRAQGSPLVDLKPVDFRNRVLAGGLFGIWDPSATISTVTLLDENTLGYYNHALGTILDGTEPHFPLPFFTCGCDPTLFDTDEPNLAAGASVLGDWLSTDPLPLNGNWSSPQAIPPTWDLNTENAILYVIDAGPGGISNVRGNFEADNGVYVWVNGQFKFGARNPGTISTGDEFEYADIDLGSLSPGLNFVQIVREDSGITTGFRIRITGQINPGVDLRLRKVADEAPVRAGTPFDYHMTVSNAGPGTATSVVLTDRIPSTFSFLSITSSQGHCTVSNHVVTCRFDTLMEGESAFAILKVRPRIAGSFTNVARVLAVEFELRPRDNKAICVKVIDCVQYTATLTVAQTCTGTPCILSAQLRIENGTSNNLPRTRVRFFLSADAVLQTPLDTLLDSRDIGLLQPATTRTIRLEEPLDESASGSFLLAVDDGGCIIASAQIP